ncbi:MAG: utilization substance protein B-like protein [Verrucomicrobiota bacterium]
MNDPRTASNSPHPTKAGLRREGREAAVQFLYQHDQSESQAPQASQDPQDPPTPPAPNADFWRLRGAAGDMEDPPAPYAPTAGKARAFAETLIAGVLAHRADLDETIARIAKNYELHRIAAVDRNILRIALFELLHNPEVPAPVAINEAIEIAKRFGTEESGRFVNGILDKVRAELPPERRSRPPRRTPPAPHPPQSPKNP